MKIYVAGRESGIRTMTTEGKKPNGNLCSYQPGKKEVNNNCSFCFTPSNFQLIAAKMPWYDEWVNSKLKFSPLVFHHEQSPKKRLFFVMPFRRQ